MKSKKIFALALLGITTGVCVYGGDEIVWQKKEMDADRCKQQGKTTQRCQKENADDNKYSFESNLSPDVYKVYENFTPDEKTMAMNYADNNRMDPNDAVAKVAKRKNAY
jgi:hypothetical protein